VRLRRASLRAAAAAVVFGEIFRGGARRSNDRTHLEGFRAIVMPRVESFSYAYQALRNLGFAITPEVTLSITVALVDARGNAFWEKRYASGPFEGDTYFLSTSPGDEISKAAHRAMYELLHRAAADVRAQLAAEVRPES
jgi:hypothetical protein